MPASGKAGESGSVQSTHGVRGQASREREQARAVMESWGLFVPEESLLGCHLQETQSLGSQMGRV